MQCSFLLTVLASSLISPLSLHDALPICALAIEPRLLLLDEVLAGLNPSEVRDMVPVIRAIANRGVTIVMIEHIMQAVMSLAEHVFVLSEGRIIAEGMPQAIAADPRVVEAYLGHGAAQRMTAGASQGTFHG